MRATFLALTLVLSTLAGSARASTVRLLDQTLAPAIPISTALPDDGGGDGAAKHVGAGRQIGGVTLVLLGSAGVFVGGAATVFGLSLFATAGDAGADSLDGFAALFIGGPLLLLGVPLVILGVVGIVTGVGLLATPPGAGGDAPALSAMPVAPTEERRAPTAFTPLAWSGRF